jgi:hypothetical protein
MPTIVTQSSHAQKKLFHNEWINVYPTTLRLEQIQFWKENNRTIFTFERLERLKTKKLENIPIEEITQFVAEQDTHKLLALTDSIRRNGVQVPLIIRDDGKLLDGNRRYFACEWLRIRSAERGEPAPSALSEIPVLIIRKADLKDALELKILAEANFIPSLKVPWPLDAQARAVAQFYEEFRSVHNADVETALAEVVGVFGISRQRAVDLMEVLELTKKFIGMGRGRNEKMRRREIVEDKFVYFWEFLNKAMKGRGAYTNLKELDEVVSMFFQLMVKGRDNPITNVKQVEPLAQARRDALAWSILTESNGAKLTLAVSVVNEKKDIRKAEDKIRVFLDWLRGVMDLPGNAKTLLGEVAELAKRRSRD